MGTKRWKKSKPFVMVYKSMIKSEAWLTLNHTSVRAYIHLMEKYNGHNENDLSLTYKEMDPFMNRRTFSNALKQLEEIGFIRKVKQGGLLRNPNIFAISDRWKWYGEERRRKQKVRGT